MTDNKKDNEGYDGYFPKNSVIEFHKKSYGAYNGYADIRIFIKDGKYNGYTVLVNDEGNHHE
jgi:hypothetical protein